MRKLIWVLPLVGAAILRAGEVPPPPGPAAGGDKPGGEKSASGEIDFNPPDNDPRRDPFSYIKYVPPPKDKDTTKDDLAKRKMEEERKKIESKKRAIEFAYNQAEQSLMQAKGLDTVTHCDDAMKTFKEIDSSMISEQQLEPLRDKVLRLRKAGEQLKNRQDAEAAFKTLGIKVTGVVARDHGSQAIVNSKIVSKGEVVTTSNDSDVIVEDILPRQVVFLFKNYKILLRVSDLQSP